MNITTARRMATLLVAGVILVSAAPAGAAVKVTATRSRRVDARVQGSFAMLADVTAAFNVTGEHTGQKLHRKWLILPLACRHHICRKLALARQRGNGTDQHLILKRTGPGRYTGGGVFYVALKCSGRLYRRGSRVPFTITVTVTRTKTVEGVRFARRLSATYNNPSRSDSTPCPLGPSHDAARYIGRATTRLPARPVAEFTDRVDSADATVDFRDASRRRSAAPIDAWRWSFDDPASAVNRSSAEDPTHRFSAPGSYKVTLRIEDANGLRGTVTQLVVVPVPPVTPSTRSVASTAFSSLTRRTAASRPGWITA